MGKYICNFTHPQGIHVQNTKRVCAAQCQRNKQSSPRSQGAQDGNGYVFQEGIQIPIRHMTRCSPSWILRDRTTRSPRVRKISWRSTQKPTSVFLPAESHRERSLAGYSPWGHRVRHDWSDLAHTYRSEAQFGIMPPTASWMDRLIMILSAGGQREKDKCHKVSFTIIL